MLVECHLCFTRLLVLLATTCGGHRIVDRFFTYCVCMGLFMIGLHFFVSRSQFWDDLGFTKSSSCEGPPKGF